MKKVKSGIILLKDIKYLENSRLRDKGEVSELMEDIQKNGLLQSIGIRTGDRAIIFGNRRVSAYKKLDYKEIRADFFEDVTDEDLIAMNLAENIKRKDINSVEIGRCIKILIDKGLTRMEIASKLVMSPSRVSSSLRSYELAAGTPFAKSITYGKLGAGNSSIGESLVWKVSEAIKVSNRILSKAEWNIVMKAMEEGLLISGNAATFRTTLINHKDISIVRALEILEKSKVIHINIVLNRKVLSEMMAKAKVDTEVEFIKTIVRKYNRDLFF